ncbi:HAD-IIIA family hydrolase [Candidatus Woesearchaeota archaeon]|nr:HAD-IIIA family hydrolase [Candidatus Woesearchaeota archaeon]
MIKAVIFDFDMTLNYSLFQKIFLMWKFCRASGEGFLKLIFRLPKFFGTNFKQLVKDYSHFTIPEAKKVYISAFKDTEWLCIFTGKKLIPELRKQKYKIGIVSNELSENINYSLKKHNIKINKVISTFGFKKAKPHPMALNKMLRILKVKPSEAVYVGDHPNDIKMAKRAKVKMIAIKTILQNKKDLLDCKPDYLIRNVNEVKRILKEINH